MGLSYWFSLRMKDNLRDKHIHVRKKGQYALIFYNELHDNTQKGHVQPIYMFKNFAGFCYKNIESANVKFMLNKIYSSILTNLIT